jgi:predicted O-linked N-acetylglucosamine transferase (SPINDLY family)
LDLKQHEAALSSYDQAILLKPEYPEAHNNRGNVLHDLGYLQDALTSFDRAIALRPGFAEAYSNRGNALRMLNQHNSALESFDKAISVKPAYAEGHNNRGNALQELRRHSAAIESYDRAIALKPNYAQAYYNRGTALQRLGQHQAAVASYDHAAALQANLAYLDGTRLHAKMHVCDWNGIDRQIAELAEKIRDGQRVAQPFHVLALTSSLPLQRKAAEVWINSKFPETSDLPEAPHRSKHDKIRIGYFSADYHDHPVAYLMAELFELHDRDNFEFVAFSFGPDQNDAMRRRISAAFERFVDVRSRSDRDVAILSRQLEIDIAIDLSGLTGNGRPGILWHRAAPVQVSYLGYPGTMGARFVDYLVSDRTLIPDGCRHHYSEKIVYLPNSYQANDSKRTIATKVFTREALGLPASGFVFCCFNSSYKFTRDTFDGWMRILRQVSGSVIWLLESNPESTVNLRKEAIRRGVDAGRLVFGKRLPLTEHLARHRTADLFLDTFPYNAHSTASDSLWAGLPVLTRVGEAFASRVAASLLNAMHLPELVTTTQLEYEALAVELATNPQRLQNLKERLEMNRGSTPLFDTEQLTRDIEDACTQMYDRAQAGLLPEDIYVGAQPKC